MHHRYIVTRHRCAVHLIAMLSVVVSRVKVLGGGGPKRGHSLHSEGKSDNDSLT